MTAKPQQATTTSSPWLLALALSTPIILLPCTQLYSLPIVIFAILGIFMLLGLLRHRQTFNVEDKTLRVLPRCVLFILLPMLISSIDAHAPMLALKASVNYMFFGLMALAVAILLRAQAAFKQVAIISSVLVCIWAFNGVAQVALGIDMFGKSMADEYGYANSFFADSQQYGFFIGALAAIPLYTLCLLGANRLTHLLVMVLLTLGVLFGGVRSGWLMFAWALMPYIYLAYIKPAKRPIVPMIVVPAFVAAVVFAALSSSSLLKQQVTNSQGLLTGNTQQMNFASHDYIELWKLTGNIVGQHLVNGVGVNNFTSAFMPNLVPYAAVPTSIDVSHPHHVWLEVAVSTGLFGLFGLLFVYAAMWRLWRTATPDQQALALPMLMPVLVLWWPINAHHGFYSLPLAALTLFCLAFSIAALTYRGEMK